MYGYDPSQSDSPVDPTDILRQLTQGASMIPSPQQLDLSAGTGQIPAATGIATELIRRRQEAEIKKPGGVRRFFAGALQGMAAAAMKEATGQTPEEAEYMRARTTDAYSQVAMRKAQMEQVGRMMEPVTIPDFRDPTGQKTLTLPSFLAEKAFPAYIAAQSRENVAATNAGSRENVANIQGTTARDVAKTRADAATALAQNRPSMTRWVQTINDQNSTPEQKDLAEKNIKLMHGLQMQQQEARGRSFAYYRGLYQWQTVYDPESGQTRPAQGWEVAQAQQQGKPFTASGRLSAKELLAVQQLSSEATPAINKVRTNLSAYDNDRDRAIFARVIHDAGIPRYGQESGWMGNVIDQALKEGLSPQGQALARDLSRLNETVGRFRTVMGAPSTDTQMALAMAMLPGPSTPNSAYAKGQLDNFDDMVKLAVGVPLLSGGGKGRGGKPTTDGAQPKANKRFNPATGQIEDIP